MLNLSRIALAAALVACTSLPALASLNQSGVGTSGAVAPTGAPGKAKVFTAVVDSTGAFVRGSTGATSGLAGTAAYEVFFLDKNSLPVDVTGCTFTATLGTIADGTAAPGVATTARRAAVDNGVWVQTFDLTGASVARAFHLVVACP